MMSPRFATLEETSEAKFRSGTAKDGLRSLFDKGWGPM